MRKKQKRIPRDKFATIQRSINRVRKESPRGKKICLRRNRPADKLISDTRAIRKKYPLLKPCNGQCFIMITQAKEYRCEKMLV